MTDRVTRRRALRATGSACLAPLTGGCLFGAFSGPDSGTLRIANGASTEISLTLDLRKVSTDPDLVYSPGPDRPPVRTPLWTETDQFTVGAESELTRGNYITEAGTYYVRIQIENETAGTGWYTVGEAADGGVTGDYLSVSISSPSEAHIFSVQSGA